MSAVAIVRSLLAGNAALLAVVPATSILSGALPKDTVPPAIGVMEVVTTEIPHIDATSPTTLVEGHVQVTVVAADYPTLKSIHALARKACNYQHGTFAGFAVVSVRRTANGPDLSDGSANFYMQSLDIAVTYYEPNT